MILHLHSNATVPLPEKLEAFHAEHLFGLEDAGARDIVAWQPFLCPLSGELFRFLLQLVELAIEPIVGLLGDCVDAVLDVALGVEPVLALLRERIPERRVGVPELSQSPNPVCGCSGQPVAIQVLCTCAEARGAVTSIQTKSAVGADMGRSRATKNVGHGFSASSGVIRGALLSLLHTACRRRQYRCRLRLYPCCSKSSYVAGRAPVSSVHPSKHIAHGFGFMNDPMPHRLLATLGGVLSGTFTTRTRPSPTTAPSSTPARDTRVLTTAESNATITESAVRRTRCATEVCPPVAIQKRRTSLMSSE